MYNIRGCKIASPFRGTENIMTDKKKETVKIILRGIIALALFAVAIWKYDVLSNIDIEAMIAGIDSQALVWLAVLGVYLIKAMVFVIPASVIYVAVGAALPAAQAVCLNLLGILLEVTATYFLGRFLGADYVERLLSKKEAGRKILKMDIQNKKSLMFTVRFLPAFPIDFVSLFFGASHCNFFKYLLFSILGIAPRVILFTILGDGIFAWIPMDKIVLIVICAIPVGVIAYFIKKFAVDKKKSQAAEESDKNNQ